MSSPEVWTTERVAVALGCNVQQVTKLIRQGRLPAKMFGKTYRVKPQDVANFIDTLEAA